jgi:hypothetical protein
VNVGQSLRAGTALGQYAALVPAWVLARAKDFFIYTAPQFNPLAAGATATQMIQIDGESDFLAVAWNIEVLDAGALTVPTHPPLTIAVSDTGSGRYAQNRATPVSIVMGSGELPGYLPYPKLFPRSGTVSVQLVNRDGANAFDVFVSMLGFKIFGQQEEGQGPPTVDQLVQAVIDRLAAAGVAGVADGPGYI